MIIIGGHSLYKPESEQIELLRGGSIVSTLVGAFGSAVRETRLTALLGYLIALESEHFLTLFGFKGKVRSIILENREDAGRSDISIETTSGIGVVEAKVGAIDPLKQSKQYKSDWTALITQHIPTRLQRDIKSVKYINWQRIANLLEKLSHSHSPKIRFISQDLRNYLEDNGMIRKSESVEVYAREINEPVTLAMFLKANIYGCWYESGSRLPKAQYFAPHFGQSIAYTHPGVRVGVSYIARIEHVEVVETWQDLVDAIISIRGKHWWKSHAAIINPIRANPDWNWSSGKKRSFIFLSTPRLVFNPPVLKDNLQKGKGWLSKRFLSFDELFKAWGC